MAIKVGINGFGRIGRNFYRAHLARGGGFDIVAVNDLAPPDVLAHVLRYDSSHGVLDAKIEHSADEISVDGKSFRVLSERDPGGPVGIITEPAQVDDRGFLARRLKPSGRCPAKLLGRFAFALAIADADHEEPADAAVVVDELLGNARSVAFETLTIERGFDRLP